MVISDVDRRILAALRRLGPATASELELGADLVGAPIREELARMAEEQLVTSHRTSGGYEQFIYALSRKGAKRLTDIG
ncbi:MAG TPA: hypothetical protein VF212_00730 [Longimicrobiales bacterium]